jgi:flagellar protein FliS
MRGIASYKNVALESSDQRKLVVMCFEALIRRQMQAKERLVQGKIVLANDDLRICREIFCELLLALDEEQAPDLSANLAQLYDFCIRELVHAGAEHDPARLDGILKVTHILYDGFKHAFDGDDK